MSAQIRMSSRSKGFKWQFSWCSGDARRQVLLGGTRKGRVRQYERSNTVKGLGPYRCSLLALWYAWGMGFLQGSEQKDPSVTLALRRDCAGGVRGHYKHLGKGELCHCWRQLEGVTDIQALSTYDEMWWMVMFYFSTKKYFSVYLIQQPLVREHLL